MMRFLGFLVPLLLVIPTALGSPGDASSSTVQCYPNRHNMDLDLDKFAGDCNVLVNSLFPHPNVEAFTSLVWFGRVTSHMIHGHCQLRIDHAPTTAPFNGPFDRYWRIVWPRVSIQVENVMWTCVQGIDDWRRARGWGGELSWFDESPWRRGGGWFRVILEYVDVGAQAGGSSVDATARHAVNQPGAVEKAGGSRSTTPPKTAK